MSDKSTPPTQFASAERSLPGEIARQFSRFTAFPLVCAILNTVPDIVTILNQNRQLVYNNQSLLKFLSLKDSSTLRNRSPDDDAC